MRRYSISIGLASIVLLAVGCSVPLVPLDLNTKPDYTPLPAIAVEMPVKPLIQGSDEIILVFDGFFENGRYKLPLRTVLEKTVPSRIAEAFGPCPDSPLNVCQLDVIVQSAIVKLHGAGEPADFSIKVATRMKTPNGCAVASKTFASAKRSVFDGRGVPVAVWDACDNIANQIIGFYSPRDDVAALSRSLLENDTSRPRKPVTVSRVRHPRSPDRAGVLPPDMRRSVSTDNRWRALLIGISDYTATNGYAPSLGGVPVSDVQQLGDILENRYGFSRVDMLLDQAASRHGILSALSELHTSVDERDNVLIYYAGHGHLPSHNIGVWVPADAVSEMDGISNSEIKDRLAHLPCRRVLLVSDSCFSGSFLTRDTTAVSPEDVVQNPQQANEVSIDLAHNIRISREVITSGNLCPVVNTGIGPCKNNSPFACTMLTALQSAPPGSALSTTDIFVDLYHNIQKLYETENDRPRPQRGTLAGHAGGEFFFVCRVD